MGFAEADIQAADRTIRQAGPRLATLRETKDALQARADTVRQGQSRDHTYTFGCACVRVWWTHCVRVCQG
jgi:hypothetical protein